MGSFLIMGLFGIIITMIVNIFMQRIPLVKQIGATGSSLDWPRCPCDFKIRHHVELSLCGENGSSGNRYGIIFRRPHILAYIGGHGNLLCHKVLQDIRRGKTQEDAAEHRNRDVCRRGSEMVRHNSHWTMELGLSASSSMFDFHVRCPSALQDGKPHVQGVQGPAGPVFRASVPELYSINYGKIANFS